MFEHLAKMMTDNFPFLETEDAEAILRLCGKNNRLFYHPESAPNYLLGYYQFFPELINIIREQDFDVLMGLDLTRGPLVYVAALITPGNGLKHVSTIVKVLNARAYAFHRYQDGELKFHFVRNNRYDGARTSHAYIN